MTPLPDEMPVVHDQASLELAWCSLMGELGFGSPQLWVMFLERDGRVRFLTHVTDVPLVPEVGVLEGARDVFGQVADGPRGLAFLYCRPGGGARTAGDLGWGQALAGLYPGGWPVHLANDVELRVLAPDELGETA